MSSPDNDGYIWGKCQLVVLNTMVHSSQQFILSDPLKVTEDDDLLKSFALITESQCLVFTENVVIMVCLTDKMQKSIRYPQGVG
jgi:hypothetical protein